MDYVRDCLRRTASPGCRLRPLAALLAALLVACAPGVGTLAPTAAAPRPAATPAAQPAASATMDAAPSAVPAPGTDAAFSGESAYQHVAQLAGAIGPRAAGTAGSEAAAGYIASTLAAYGYGVERQRFTFPRFEEREVRLRAAPAGTAPEGELAPEARAMLYSAAGAVTGPLVFAGYGRPEDFPPEGAGGAVALVERGEGITFRDKAEAAARAGARAVVIYNNLPPPFVGSLQVQSPVPVVAVAGRDGALLRALLDGGSVTATVVVDAGIEVQNGENVIGTREALSPAAPPRTIVVGAHYDSVEVGPGANDNASGTAVMLEMARALAQRAPQARLVFAAFGAEELGLLGSAHYTGQLSPGERAQLIAMLNFDMVGVGTELHVGGDDALVQLVDAAGVTQGLSFGRMGREALGRSDQASFIALGVPSVFFHVSDDPNYHTAQDTPDHVSAHLLHQIGVVGADVVVALAGR